MLIEARLLRIPDGRESVALRSQIGISGPDAEKRTSWVHVAPFGEWKGHTSGDFAVTSDVLASAIATFNAQANPIAVDYGHASVFAFEAPAAGYVQKLEQRDDGLWAQVEWTKRAAQSIRDGEYRFCSAVFLWNQKHRQTGEKVPCQLHSIALTNVPFIDGQQPIVLSRRIAAPTLKVTRLSMDAIAKDEILKAIKALDGEEVTAAQIASLVEGIAKIKAAQSGSASEEKPEGEEKPTEATTPAATPASSTVATGTAGGLAAEPAKTATTTTPAADQAAPPPDGAAVLAKLEELAAKAGTDVMGLLAQIEQMLAPAADAGGAPAAMSTSTLTARLEATSIALRTLTARVREFEADAEKRATAEKARLAAEAEAKIQTALTTALTSGQILEADRAKWEKIARADIGAFTELTSSLPKVVPTGKEAAATAGATSALPADAKAPIVLDEANEKVIALRQRAKDVKGIGPGPAQDAFVRDHLPFMGR